MIILASFFIPRPPLFLSLADCELEELEAPQRYRPDSLAQICKTTKFSEPEIKRMYRGFKNHCPNGMVKEDTFKIIYAQFFPQGGEYHVVNAAYSASHNPCLISFPLFLFECMSIAMAANEDE
jgi:Ca2+-binding EF-hand superfamily protein